MSGMHQPIGNDMSSGNPATDPILHVIDFEDVALSKVGFQILHLGGQAVLRQYMPTIDAEHLTPEQVMKMFIDQVYWEENSGGLILCTSMADTSLCLPIPKDHWTVSTEGKTFQ